MATPQLTFVPGRRAGSENAVVNGFRYIKDRDRDDKRYMKCVLYKDHGCKARITVDLTTKEPFLMSLKMLYLLPGDT